MDAGFAFLFLDADLRGATPRRAGSHRLEYMRRFMCQQGKSLILVRSKTALAEKYMLPHCYSINSMSASDDIGNLVVVNANGFRTLPYEVL